MPSEDFTIGAGVWPGLAKLVEETGELQQVLGKLVAFPDGDHPDGSDLHERLVEEVADVQAAIDFLLAHSPVDVDRIAARRWSKTARFEGWHQDALGATSRASSEPAQQQKGGRS